MSNAAQSPEKSPEDWIRIVSTDGYSCLVRRKVAMTSGTLRDMLDAGFAEASANTCRAEERGVVVEKLCEYLQYKWTYERASPKEDIPDFSERIPPEVALELVIAADYYNT
ncbi:hypothetical protein PHLGIDRAFT_107850 [Phlebiopsis gigantea 11061_1 CR5-6]|uniref:Elongin-C n=1 Tax=Phlebiopsis gigantea (strain 11061_1 CR5-6) TaxID=745531 RepID=A0A0C3NL33_PHLG1|nr:hypothetical protein PHLGIDRAFT_107850 [Phlebiopsis gigantea 11061_1 CR5-6]